MLVLSHEGQTRNTRHLREVITTKTTKFYAGLATEHRQLATACALATKDEPTESSAYATALQQPAALSHESQSGQSQ